MATRLRRLLLGGTVALAVLALTGCGIVQDVVEQATGGSSPDTASEVSGTGEDTDIFAIAVGDCLNDGDSSGEVQSAPAVACSEPHDSEAYASVMVADGEFPGEETIAAQAENDCYAAFAPFVGTAYEEVAGRGPVARNVASSPPMTRHCNGRNIGVGATHHAPRSGDS
jgi:hypothetical protein